VQNAMNSIWDELNEASDPTFLGWREVNIL